MAVRLTVAILAFLLAGCAKTDPNFDGGLVDVHNFEAGVLCSPTDVDGDADGDGISNGLEGCLDPKADADNDGTNNWQDWDSDGDRIPDSVEAGPKTASGECATSKNKSWPCDHDGDGTPDYLDLDSDNDKLLDQDEDANGDGYLGCCLVKCGQVDEKWQKTNCTLTDDGCGAGQKCENGTCTPSATFSCSEGETHPLFKDTFGDGKLDIERGTFICRDATEDKPQGRKMPQNRQSQTGDWNVAMEKSAKYAELALPTPAAKEAAASIDEDDPAAEVAGFVLSKTTDKEKVQDELKALLDAINARVPAGPGKVTVRSSGAEVKSHDRFDSVQGTILDLTLTSSSNVSHIRNELLGTLLGRPMAQMGNLPAAYGSSGTEFVIRFVTVRRFGFQKDSNGKEVLDQSKSCAGGPCPIDNNDKGKWRLLVMGAVALRGNYQDPMKRTGFLADDLSNGTGLATYTDGLSDECDVGTINQLPVADIIWVIDESGSMDDNRKDIVANANNFFSRALASGLDFRMCVTGVCSAKSWSSSSYCPKVIGKCCSKAASENNHDGGTDRFLLPTEQSIFSACVDNPPGDEGGSEYGLTNAIEAVKTHLPRGASSDRIRPEAKLVIIVATDEAPQEYKDASITSGYGSCTLDAAKQAAAAAYLKPWMDLFTGTSDPEAAAMVHLIGGVCGNSCGAEVGHGYQELAQALGGQIGDVCQKDLGNTLQVIIDSIVGAASPIKLDYVPISSTLAVALDGKEVLRSRTNGFDFRSSSNSIVFINVKYTKGSEVISSYHRWKEQQIPQ